MKTQVFVPLYDELMYEHPERIRGPIMAFDPESIRVFRDDQSWQWIDTSQYLLLPQSTGFFMLLIGLLLLIALAKFGA